MKFLLVGHGGAYNRGCEAILRTTISLLNDYFKYPDIIVSAFDYDNEKNSDYGKNVYIIPAVLKNIWKLGTWQWALRQLFRIFNKNREWQLPYLPLVKSIKESDAVISIGGDNYTLDYGFPDYYLGLNKLVKEKKKKLIIWGASVGPFNDSIKLEAIAGNLRMTDLITVRETCSYDYLASIGVNKNVKLTADTAFLLSSEPVPLNQYSFEGVDGILGFNLSPILTRYSDGKSQESIIDEVSVFLKKAINDNNLGVWLIPHVTKKDGTNNDYTFMTRIYNNLRDTGRIVQVSSDYNAMQMKYIISKCRFFVGARTHATIAAFSSNVPTISIGYSLKSKGINKDIFGCDEYVINVKDITGSILYDKFNKILDIEDKIKELLRKYVVRQKESAYLNVTLLGNILNNKYDKS